MSTVTPTTYAQNERVLCYHGPLMYEAKVLKAEVLETGNAKTGSGGIHYFVHYKGWKQTWDEWVPPTRLLKYNEQNIQLQKQLTQAQNAASASSSAANHKSSASASASARPGGSSRRKDGAGRGTKRGREDEDAGKRPELKLAVPEALKVMLVDDWEAVTKNMQLVTLPRSPTVHELLQEFQAHVFANPSPNLRDPKIVLPTILAGLQVYFDRAVGANLLYRFERAQYAEIRRRYVTGPTVQVGQEKEMSHVYGAEHLLRMIVSLPSMIALTTMDPESIGYVRDYVGELMTWMLQERHRIFQQEYESASLQYQSVSRS
ncbi:MRG-domain-containing protein [Stereum hirsutum FP-91666 SS1]|uniref:MRG-domain-containing protein n=1 Tax=Stereum hirsutum (strain FP-91666) TaxID=721885 RepID=UPI0004449E39|nr:MRG-domain-containing protein [Stereum hirsutum FP-91666 SS1]EIM84882.1 MRG-domain-containing protein [Stereum hirsutum FP-91666 SS1]